MKWIKLNKHICINKVRETCINSKFFSQKPSPPFCLNFQNHSPHFVRCINSIYMKTQICMYKLKIFLPLFVNHQQRGENQINNKDIYAIYIHKVKDVKLAPLHTCITWRRDDKTLTHIKYNIQCKSGDVKLPLHTCIT